MKIPGHVPGHVYNSASPSPTSVRSRNRAALCLQTKETLARRNYPPAVGPIIGPTLKNGGNPEDSMCRVIGE